MNTKNKIFGSIIAIASVFFFSTYTIFGTILLQNLYAETLIALSAVLSVFLIFLIYGFLPELKELHTLSRKTIGLLFFISFLSAVFAPLLFLKGLQDTMATNAMIIGKIEPVLVGIISVLWLHEKFSKYQIIGSILMIFGVFFVATQGFSIGFSLETPGDIFIMAGGLFGAISTTIFKKYLHNIRPEIVVLMRNAVGGFFLLFLFPLFFDFTHSTEKIFTQEILIPLFGFALFTILLAQIFWYKSLDCIEASKLSTFSMLGPIFGIIMAILILEEEIYTYHIIGFLFVLFGLSITLYHEQKDLHHEKHMRMKHFFHH